MRNWFSGSRGAARPWGPGLSGAAFWIAATGTAILAGLLPVLLPPAGGRVVLAFGAGIVACLLLRRGMRALSDRGQPGTGSGIGGSGRGDAEAESPGPADLRWARRLFYLGTATILIASTRPALGLTFSEICTIASFLVCVLAVLRGHRVAPVPTGLVAGVALYAAGGAISSVGANSPAQSGTEVLQAVYVMLFWIWTATMVLQTRQQLFTALTLWTASAAFCGFAAVLQVAGGEQFVGVLKEGNRATGLLPHPNDLGAAMSIAFVPAVFLATRHLPERPTRAVVARWSVVGLIGAGIVAAASIAGMVACLVAVVVWLASPSVRAPARALIALVLVAVLASLVLAVSNVTSPSERFGQVTSFSATNPSSGSGEVRIRAVRAAWEEIVEDPLVGRGLDPEGKIVNFLDRGRPVVGQIHQGVVSAWYEAGFLGLLGLLVILAAIASVPLRAVRQPLAADDLALGWVLLAAFAAFFVFLMSSPFSFQQYGWIVAVMLVAWYGLRDRVTEPEPELELEVALSPSSPLPPPAGTLPRVQPHSA